MSEPVNRANEGILNCQLPGTAPSLPGGDTSSNELIMDGATWAARKFFEIGTVLISFATIAYVVGYLTARAYFDEFHASWVVSQLSPTVFLTYSIVPIAALVFFIYLGITDLIEGGKRREKAAFFIVRWGSNAMVVWFVLEVIIRQLWRPSPAIAFIGFILATFLAGAVVETMVLRVKDRQVARARALFCIQHRFPWSVPQPNKIR